MELKEERISKEWNLFIQILLAVDDIMINQTHLRPQEVVLNWYHFQMSNLMGNEREHPNLELYRAVHAGKMTIGIGRESAFLRGCQALQDIIELHDVLLNLDTTMRPPTPDFNDMSIVPIATHYFLPNMCKKTVSQSTRSSSNMNQTAHKL